jgi:hypothetical protein
MKQKLISTGTLRKSISLGIESDAMPKTHCGTFWNPHFGEWIVLPYGATVTEEELRRRAKEYKEAQTSGNALSSG